MGNSLTFQIETDELEIFLQDVNEHLQQMEAGLLSLEQIADPNTLHSVFRAAHTLKAIAGTIGHQQMAELTHALETLFDAMREGLLTFTPEIADELLAMVNLLRALRDEVISHEPCGIDVEDAMRRLRLLVEPTNRPSAIGITQSTLIAAITPEQAEVISSCRENECPVFEIYVTVNRTAHGSAARLLQAALVMAEIGQIIAQQPKEDDLLEDRHNYSLQLILA